MAHVLAKLIDVDFDEIRQTLEDDAPAHKEQGLVLEHLWRNVEDAREVLFLFRVDDLNEARILIKRLHEEALKADPKVNLPQLTYLQGA
jgi:hypothetical protein